MRRAVARGIRGSCSAVSVAARPGPAVNGQTRGAIGSDQLLCGNAENANTGGLPCRFLQPSSSETSVSIPSKAASSVAHSAPEKFSSTNVWFQGIFDASGLRFGTKLDRDLVSSCQLTFPASSKSRQYQNHNQGKMFRRHYELVFAMEFNRSPEQSASAPRGPQSPVTARCRLFWTGLK